MQANGDKCEVIYNPRSNMTGIMPHFLSTVHCQMQYLIDVDCTTDISIANMKKLAHKYNLMQNCPDWSAGEKCGRPKKNNKVMTVMDHIEASPRRKARVL